MRAISIAFAVLLSTTAFAETKKAYTLADLKSLVAQKSYKEAVGHLADVAPAERKDEWVNVAVEATAGYIASLSNDDIVTKILEIERVDSEFPVILKSPKYTKARMDVGAGVFKICFSHQYAYETCRDHMWKFMQDDPDNGELGFRLGKVMRWGSSTHWTALRYFKSAFKGKAIKERCADDDVHMAVVSGFHLNAKNELLATAKDIASACFDYLKKPMLVELDQKHERYLKAACPVLMAKKALDADRAKLCK
jgi:hypothetical protein